MAQPDGPSVDQQTLTLHLDLLDQATQDDLDELLADLLKHAYGTVAAQKS